MNRVRTIVLSGLCLAAAAACTAGAERPAIAGVDAPASGKKPNILFIVMDDLNADTSVYGGQALTPNMERLAARGVRFENGYSVVPACNPSRVALLTGQRPETTGQYVNEGNFRDKPGGAERVTLPQWLRGQGYTTVAAGKIFHHPRGRGKDVPATSDPQSWDVQARVETGTGGMATYLDKDGWARWLKGADNFTGLKIGDYIRKNGIWGPIAEPKEETGDFQVARYCADYLKKAQETPFMLACGLARPHAPHLAPKEYFDLYPLDKIRMPNSPDSDLNDVPKIAKTNWSSGFARKLRSEPEEWRKAVQGYLASTSFADAAVGRILDALEASGRDKDTIVVIIGDHGFQVGQKNRWEKFTLWDLGGRTTMIMAIPGISGRTVKPAVSFLDIFPTIAGLVNGSRPAFVEGHDLMPLVRDPQMNWDKPAVQSYQQGNVGVRFGPWNYIRYKDGSEELYNLDTDPLEFDNLVAKGRGKHRKLIERLQIYLPKVTNPQVDYKPMG